MTTDPQADVIVIGAGIIGLLAAGSLKGNGARVLVFDKGRGVGRRLATRRTETAVFDHKAQLFTARNPQFHLLVKTWLAAGLARSWALASQSPMGSLRVCLAN